MKTFIQFITEYSIDDIRYFEELPDIKISQKVQDIADRYHVGQGLHWKLLKSKCFPTSFELEDGIIALKPHETFEVKVHEVAHEIYDYSHKEKIIPILERIRVSCAAPSDGPSDKLHYIRMNNGFRYSVDHSGNFFIQDETFAISFAYIEADKGYFKDPKIDKDFRKILQDLQDNPLWNPNPYSNDSTSQKIAG